MQLHSTCLLNELIFNQKLLSLIIGCAINIHFNSADETPSCVLPPDSQPPPPKGNSFPSGLYASLRGRSSYYSLLLMFRIHLISLLTDCSNEIIDFTGETKVRGECAGKSRQHVVLRLLGAVAGGPPGRKAGTSPHLPPSPTPAHPGPGPPLAAH